MKNKILLTILLGLSTLVGTANAEKPNLHLTAIADSERTLYRGQLNWQLPHDLDLYWIGEESPEFSISGVRLAYTPLKSGPLSFGPAVQSFRDTYNSTHNELGLNLNLQGMIGESTYGKSKLRYFPSTTEFNSYSFLDGKKMFVDLNAVYNFDEDSTYMLLGVDYKLSKHVAVGIEASLTGPIDDLDVNHFGPRIRVSF